MTTGPFSASRVWWLSRVAKNVDRTAVLAKVRDDGGWNGRYAFMILMSAGIAVLGLLLSSPAVVIGAMLVSPLMGPILGLGFAVATFDARELRRNLAALAGGTILAVAFGALIVLASPLQNVTAEIAARTRPNLFDLMIALFSALAGAYAMIRGREGTIVGVAIATALMPPLGVVGFGLATGNWAVFSGSLLLFFTNLMTIALAAAAMARLYGFGPKLSPQQTLLQTGVMVVVFVALAVPLGITLRTVAGEALASRQARAALDEEFGQDSRVSAVEIDYATRPVAVSATIFTPRYHQDAGRRLSALLSRQLGRPVQVTLEQYRVGTGAADAEAAQNAGNSAKTDAADRQARELAARLALIAGVDPDAVTIDRSAHRAVVTAVALPGATLATYRALEGRVAAGADGWDVTVTPPLLPLGVVAFDGDTPDPAAIADTIWAARRLGLAVSIAGPKPQADAIAALLQQAGVATVRGPATGIARIAWAVPVQP